MTIHDAEARRHEPTTSMGAAFAKAEHSQPQQTQQAQPRGNTTMNQQQNDQQNAPRTPFKFGTMGRRLRTNISRTSVGADLKALEAKVAALYDQYKATLIVKLLPLDVQLVPEIACSALVVAVRLRDTNLKLAAFHTLVLAGTAGDLQPRVGHFGGSQYEIKQLPDGAWQPAMKTFVQGEVARAFGIETQYCVDMDATTIPADFRIDDDRLINSVGTNAIVACNTELENCLPDFADLDLVDAQAGGEALSSRVTFNDTLVYDAVGRPVRADIQIAMSAEPIKNGNGYQNNRVTPVAQLTGYVELQPDVDPKLIQAQPGFAPASGFANTWAQAPQVTKQPYQALFVITSMETAQLQTPPAQLLALVQAMMLQYNNVWANSLMPRPAGRGREMDLRDIGALGYEVPFQRDESTGMGLRVETKQSSFNQEAFAYLLSKWVQPGLAFALDVSDAGPDTWYNGVFAGAAQGSAEAVAEIIRAANTLTRNKFSPIYARLGGTGQIVDTRVSRVHRTSYVDPDGNLRDGRDYDYTAMANLRGDKNLRDLEVYSNSFLSNDPIEARLAERARLLDSMVQLSYDGMMTRVHFEAKFMQALAEACAATGLTLRPIVPNSDYGRVGRATVQFAGSLVTGQADGGLFNGSWSRQSDNTSHGSPYRGSSRWMA